MRVVIIEDELLVAADLSEIIQALQPDYTIVKVISSISEALTYFQKQPKIDLIFSDIQLEDGVSFDIFKQIQLKVPIIFCTSYNAFAHEAFKVNGLDYVLKPFRSDDIKNAIEKFEILTHKSDDSIDKLFDYFSVKQLKSNNVSLLVYQKDIITPINTNDIAIIQLKSGILKLVTFNGATYFTTQSLDEIEKLNLAFYFRANRQFILHRNIVKDVIQHFNRKFLVRLSMPFSEQIFISKEKTSAFLYWLQKN